MSNRGSSNDGSEINDSQQDFEEGLRTKVEAYYQTGLQLASKADLDGFLDYCGLLEIWDSEEEKQTVWEAIKNYQDENGVIGYEGATKGLFDLLSQREDGNESGGERESSIKLRKNSHQRTMSQFFLDVPTNKLFDYKKLFDIISSKDSKTINLNELSNEVIQEGVNLSKEEIGDCLSSFSEISSRNNCKINESLFERALSVLDYEIKKTGENDPELKNNVLYGDHDNSFEHHEINFENFEDPMELLDDLSNIEYDSMHFINSLAEVKNNFITLNNTLVMNYDKILNGEEEKTTMIDAIQKEIHIKIKEYDKLINEFNHSLKEKGARVENLKNLILKQSNNLRCLEEDYKQLFQKYQNNQQLDIDEEMERLVDENVNLQREKEEKNNVIDSLEKEKDEKENRIQILQLQIYEVEKDKEELHHQIQELKNDNEKLKKEYNTLVNDVVKKIQQDEIKQKEKEESKLQKEKEIKYSLSLSGSRLDPTNPSHQEGEQSKAASQLEKPTSNMTIPEMKRNLQQMNYDNLLSYTLKVDLENQSITQDKNAIEAKLRKLEKEFKNLKDELQQKKVNLITAQTENETLRKKVADLAHEAEFNSGYRPSLAVNQLRMSRASLANNQSTTTNKKIYSTTSNKQNVITNSKDFFSSKIGGGSTVSNQKVTTPFNLKENSNISQGIQNQKTTYMNYGNTKVNNSGLKSKTNTIINMNNKIEEEKKKIKDTSKKEIKGGEQDKKNNPLHRNIKEVVNEDDNDDEEEEKEKNKEQSINNNNLLQDIKPNSEFSITNQNSEFKGEKPKTVEDKINSENKNNKIEKQEENKVINIDDEDIVITSNIPVYDKIEENINSNKQFHKKNFHAKSHLFAPKPMAFDEEGDKNDDGLDGDIEIQASGKGPAFQPVFEGDNEIEVDGYELDDGPMNNSMEIRDTMCIKENLDDNNDLENALCGEGEEEEDEEVVIGGNKEVKFEKESKNNSTNKPKAKKMVKANTSSNFKIKNNPKLTSTATPSKTNPKALNAPSSLAHKNKPKPKGGVNNFKKEAEFLDLDGVNDNNVTKAIKKTNINTHYKSNTMVIKEEIQKELNFSSGQKKKTNVSFKTPVTKINTQKITEKSEPIKSVKSIPSSDKSLKHAHTKTNVSNSAISSKGSHGRYKSSNLVCQSARLNSKFSGDIYAQFDTPVNQDFLQIVTKNQIKDTLKKNNDNTTPDKIFTDVIFLLEEASKKHRMNIVITPNNLYLIDPEEYKCKIAYKSEHLSTIIMSNKNTNYLVFNFSTGEDMVIETLRRLELLYFIRDNYRSKDKNVKFQYRDDFTIKIKGKLINYSFSSKGLSSISNLEGAQKFGYLYKYNDRLIGKNFSERLVVLTNIGLIYFDETRKIPRKLIPVVGSLIRKFEGEKYKRPHCIEIKNGEDTNIFAASSQEDLDSWYDELMKMQAIYEEKMKTIDTRKKEEEIENEKELEHEENNLENCNEESKEAEEDEKEDEKEQKGK